MFRDVFKLLSLAWMSLLKFHFGLTALSNSFKSLALSSAGGKVCRYFSKSLGTGVGVNTYVYIYIYVCVYTIYIYCRCISTEGWFLNFFVNFFETEKNIRIYFNLEVILFMFWTISQIFFKSFSAEMSKLQAAAHRKLSSELLACNTEVKMLIWKRNAYFHVLLSCFLIRWTRFHMPEVLNVHVNEN